MDFDANCAPSEALLGQYFYEGLRPLIKFWIDKEGREWLTRNDLVRKVTRAEAKAKIQTANSRELDQRCPRGKQSLKLMKKARDEQPEKATALQAKANP